MDRVDEGFRVDDGEEIALGERDLDGGDGAAEMPRVVAVDEA